MTRRTAWIAASVVVLAALFLATLSGQEAIDEAVVTAVKAEGRGRFVPEPSAIAVRASGSPSGVRRGR
jgi:hypothetical protein